MSLTRTTRRLSVAALLAAAVVVTAGVGAAGAAPSAADGWQVVKTRAAPDQSALWENVDATGADDVWTAGVQNYDLEEDGGTPVVGHWNGSSWRVYSFTVSEPTLAQVDGLDAVAPNDVWVTINDVGTKRIYHFDGTYWTRKATRGSGKRVGEIAAVPGHAWTLASDHSVATYNGSTWTSKKLVESGTLDHVEARTSKDAWAFGNAVEAPPGRLPTSWKPLALHWNGSSWSKTTSAVKDCEFTDIATVGANNAWAKCDGYDKTSRTSWWDVLHWNGKSWTKAFGPFDGQSGGGLTADAAGEIWVSTLQQVSHFDGTQWQSTPLPLPTDQQNVVSVAARGLAVVPGSDEVVAAGSAYVDDGGDYQPQFDVVWRSGG